MGYLNYSGKTVQLDDDGFLLADEDWNEDVARQLAAREGIEKLSDEQVQIISFMREYFHKYKVFPILNNVCKVTHQPKQCVNEQFINPEIAWKIAGLPKLDNIHFISMDGKTYKLETCC